MLLVMSNGGYLVPPSSSSSSPESPKQESLWNETWKRINRFQPSLFAELFPEEAKKPQKPRVSREVQQKDAEGAKGKEVAKETAKEVEEEEKDG